MPKRVTDSRRGHFTPEEVAKQEWDEEDLRVANEIVDVAIAFGECVFITVNAPADATGRALTDSAWKELGRRLVAAMELGR